MMNRDKSGRFVEGNTVTLQHGGEAAIKRLQHNEPFDGLALETYEQVLDELAIDLDLLSGIDRVRVQRAVRFEAVARLFDVAALAAAAAGDLPKWEQYQRRSGWIGSKAFNALGQIRDITQDGRTLDGLLARPVGRKDGENAGQ
jgi:hypothetical protein